MSVETIHLSEQTFDEALMAAEGLTMLDFWADWFGPCRAVAPVLEELAAGRGVTPMKVRVDENPGLAERYNVRSIPAILFVKNGEVVDRVVGAAPKAAFEKIIGARAAQWLDTAKSARSTWRVSEPTRNHHAQEPYG